MRANATYPVGNRSDFKARNLANWRTNSDFWLNGRPRHQSDVANFTSELLKKLLHESRIPGTPMLLDIGCGDGWIYSLLKDSQIKANYIGIDFNPDFVRSINDRFLANGDCEAIEFDFEHELPARLHGVADIALNFFNFFEIPQIERAFENATKTLKPGGCLVIVTLEPVLQLLSVSSSLPEFRDNLEKYQLHGEELGYDKAIDAEGTPAGRTYKGITYSVATYIKLAKKSGLTLVHLNEVIRSANKVPQIYQFLVLEKPRALSKEVSFVDFLRMEPGQALLPTLLVVTPIAVGIYLLTRMGSESQQLGFLQKLEGNAYMINNVLILAIGISQLIVFLSLVFFLYDIFRSLTATIARPEANYTRYVGWAQATTVVAFAAFIVIVAYICGAGSFVSFRSIIQINQAATVVGFSLFILIDMLMLKARTIENEILQSNPDTQDVIRKRAHNQNDIRFARSSTWLINIPTIVVTCLVVALGHYLHGGPEIFRRIYDLRLHIYAKNQIVDWNLFLDGLETGAIVAILIFSQLVFSVIKTRYSYVGFVIEKTGSGHRH